jgi:hypothetical protein
MDTSFASRLELEVLDRIGHIDFPPLNACVFQDRVKDFARRSNKGLSCDILLVSGLLADKNNLCIL